MATHTVAVIGAGNRGKKIYGNLLKDREDQIKVTAVAEPQRSRRWSFSKAHHIPKNNQFRSYHELFQQGKIADALIITTMDKHHLEPALLGMEQGYDILLEKPIVPTLEELVQIRQKQLETGSNVLIAHVLRYTPFFRKLKQLINQDTIGQVSGVNLIENVGYYHFAHSYVRGNWRNKKHSAPLFLAKSSHDFDILTWLTEKKCLQVSASGSLTYFTPENHPKGAEKRCLKCKVEPNCPYSAIHIYLDKDMPWPKDILTNMPPRYQIKLGLRFSNYGKCVYQSDNDMPETLTANMTFERGLEASFTLTAFTKYMTRTIALFGSKGEIRADLKSGNINIYPFRGDTETIYLGEDKGDHGGGDKGLIDHFINFLQGERHPDASDLSASLESHIMAMAAEEAKNTNQTIKLNPYRDKLSMKKGIF